MCGDTEIFRGISHNNFPQSALRGRGLEVNPGSASRDRVAAERDSLRRVPACGLFPTGETLVSLRGFVELVSEWARERLEALLGDWGEVWVKAQLRQATGWRPIFPPARRGWGSVSRRG